MGNAAIVQIIFEGLSENSLSRSNGVAVVGENAILLDLF